MDIREFCTCKDKDCPLNPINHDKGCDLCIQKNMEQKEIPSCFFRAIDFPKPTENWYWEDFAALVMSAKAAGKL